MSWLALPLIRVIENSTAQTWRTLHQELDRMHLVTLTTGHGTVAQRFALTAGYTRPSSPRWTCPSRPAAST